MSVKFGDRIEVIASPKLVLQLEELLSEWIAELSTQEEIDLDRECIGMAQKIVGVLAEMEGDRSASY